MPPQTWPVRARRCKQGAARSKSQRHLKEAAWGGNRTRRSPAYETRKLSTKIENIGYFILFNANKPIGSRKDVFKIYLIFHIDCSAVVLYR